MEKMYHILTVLMFAMLTQAMTCEEEDTWLVFTMTENKVPQEPSLTTISTNFFQENVAGHGWKWNYSYRIDENGIGEAYSATSLSDFTPNDLFFGTDSMTVFMYRKDSNVRRTKSYTYDASNNRILSDAIAYMQLTHADPYRIEFIELLDGHYYKNHYERMLPYEVNARWNGSKPESP